ncbi:hypothetical protein [Actinoplanes solisilvae]|uniref:hypothetical protein n=1 Tax=Actinoplanes solisilvae TaxID=2486853 RepID=UPI000FD8DF80|nr:hypothetical protein [Actinoplanes solisilvae]
MMMRVLRKGIWVGVVVVLAFMSGCGPEDPAGQMKDERAEARDADAGYRVDTVDTKYEYYDLDYDGKPEEFLLMKCKDPKDPQWHLFEIVRGGSDSETDPVKLVLQTDRGSVDHVCFIDGTAIYRFTVGGRSTVKQIRWPAGAPQPVETPRRDLEGCPSPVSPSDR